MVLYYEKKYEWRIALKGPGETFHVMTSLCTGRQFEGKAKDKKKVNFRVLLPSEGISDVMAVHA